jgi:hypothetical protein
MYENRVLRRIFEPKRDEETGVEKMRSSIMCRIPFTKYY